MTTLTNANGGTYTLSFQEQTTDPIARDADAAAIALPVDLSRSWKAAVNEPQTEAEVAAIRHSIQRVAPFGTEATKRAATRLGLQLTLHPRGRPRKSTTK